MSSNRPAARVRVSTVVVGALLLALVLHAQCRYWPTQATANSVHAPADAQHGEGTPLPTRKPRRSEAEPAGAVVAPPTLAPPTTETPAPTKPPRALPVVASADVARYRLVVHVFTYCRLAGLERLLKSLAGADYNGDTVALRVFIDHPKKNAKPRDTADHRTTLKFLDSLRWAHGPLTLHRRQANAGLKRSIIEAWYPASMDEAGAFFEDDIEVSPLWYVWATRALAEYAPPPPAPADDATAADDNTEARHGHGGAAHRAKPGSKHAGKLLGVSLFRPIHDELSGHGCVVANDFSPFALQQPCSWGAVYLPGPWRRFRGWYDAHASEPAELRDDNDPRIDPSSNTWPSESSWKKYLIKLMYESGWFMVYPNLPGRMVLSTNHLMKGEHNLPPRKLFELPLLTDRRVDDIADADARRSMSQFPPLDEMLAFDVMFHAVQTVGALPNIGAEVPA